MNNTRNAKWIKDLHQLSLELPKRHKNLFFSREGKYFYEDIDNLKSDIDMYDDYEVMVSIAKIVATIKDAHTYVSLPVRFLCPVELYWFSDGIYVVSVVEEYKEMLHSRIVSINGKDINKIIEALTEIISHENKQFLKSQLPKYIPAIELLYGLEIVDDLDELDFTYETSKGQLRTSKVKSLSISEAKKKLEKINEKIHRDKLPFYRRKNSCYYWYEYIIEFDTVYFNYGLCKEDAYKDVRSFTEDLIKIINNRKPEKLVIDIRNNFGGNSALLDPFIVYLSKNERLNKKGKIFVIIGRDTFSSALLNAISLKEKTEAIFIGEGTGGKPNCYGEVERFTLTNSRLVVAYSTEYFKAIEDDGVLYFEPDIDIELTIKDYIENIDPCLEYVLNLQSFQS